jgi:hypothetical protein
MEQETERSSRDQLVTVPEAEIEQRKEALSRRGRRHPERELRMMRSDEGITCRDGQPRPRD